MSEILQTLQTELIQVLVTAACSVLTILLTVLFRQTLLWLKEHRMYALAMEGVDYAEQKWKTGEILTEERKSTAVAYLRARGINVSDAIADLVIESVLGSINTALRKTFDTPEDPIVSERLARI